MNAPAETSTPASATAPIGGRIKTIHVPAREQIDAGDLLYTIVPA